MIIEKRKRRRRKACLQFYRSYRGKKAFKVDFIPDTRRAADFLGRRKLNYPV